MDVGLEFLKFNLQTLEQNVKSNKLKPTSKPYDFV